MSRFASGSGVDGNVVSRASGLAGVDFDVSCAVTCSAACLVSALGPRDLVVRVDGEPWFAGLDSFSSPSEEKGLRHNGVEESSLAGGEPCCAVVERVEVGVLTFGFGEIQNGAEGEHEGVLFFFVAGEGLKKMMGAGAGVLSLSAGGFESGVDSNAEVFSEVGNEAKLKLKAGCFTFGGGAAKLNLDGVSDAGALRSSSGSRGGAKLNSGAS